VPDHEEVVAVRWSPVLRGVDLLVGPVNAHAKHAHEHAATVRDFIQRRLRQLGEM
jgi:hypothetical protein